ncbi:DUF4625 domain-containing protein [Daejeonella sp. JGW-45]|uniref:DUF4625 domain-containing protein n=1 Tax=Daejeonella sp. JGW-45 TaxID=3034148 RepID=UPI0023EC1C43|nr:DUF4625 domain-containing protein [Daejeonella sp. JGW-45]
MNKVQSFSLAVLAVMALSNCSKESSDPVDTAYPVIDISAANAFPKQCSTIKRGDKFTFITQLSDNAELGSLSVDIHHNFDGHSHSTEVKDCVSDPVKTAVKPFLFIQNFSIPPGQKSHQTAIEINVPADVDAGDYHFLIRVTDKEGWQTLKGLSIKLI